MRTDVAGKLLQINAEFYQSLATAFSATRRRLRPGVLRAIRGLPSEASILDLGCGNGELARKLFQSGRRGVYVGVDSSPQLLGIARHNCDSPQARFIRADLAEAGWSTGLPAPFERVFAFAVLHHLPGRERRAGLLKDIQGLLSRDGQFVFSTWDFWSSSRLRKRILPWERVGLGMDDVDPGDFLLDWRHGGLGMRYVHLFDMDELSVLARNAGFRVVDVYRSDGENSRLGIYQVWTPAS